MQFLPTSFHTSDRFCKLTDSFKSNFTLTFFHWRQDVIIFHGELAKRSGTNKYFLEKKKSVLVLVARNSWMQLPH